MIKAHLLRLLIIWQVAIIAITLVSPSLFPLRRTFVGGDSVAYERNPLVLSRANFDGNHYVAISRQGYGHAQHSFFPMYPLLVGQITTWINPNHPQQFTVTTLVGITISLASFTIGLIVLVKLLQLDYSPKNLIEQDDLVAMKSSKRWQIVEKSKCVAGSAVKKAHIG